MKPALPSQAWLKRLGVSALAALLAACASTTETRRPDKVYQAYGETWVYSKTELHTRTPAFDSPHGFLGPRSSYRETHLVRNAAGLTISIPDTLYALQSDGTLKKIECCQYFRELGDLYNIDDRLVFVFANARKYITDCFIYPSGHPDNELKPPGERIDGVTVFAEFDPEAKIFKVSSFSAGDNYLPFEYRAALLRSGRRDLTDQQHHAFLYARRKPFMCDATGPASATLPARHPLDNSAYQGGATHTLRVAVAPAATPALLGRLQAFAAGKGYKAWTTAAAAPQDMALAIEGDDMLLVAAGDGDGRWGLALYRAMDKPPRTMPPKERADALAREVRNAVGTVPGVSIVEDVQ